MSASQLRSFYSYLNQQFRVNSVFFNIQDARRQPTHQKSTILWSWLLGFCCGIESREALYRQLKPSGLQRWLCVPDGMTLSADTLGEALEKIDLQSLEDAGLQLFFRSARMGQLRDGGPGGLRIAAVDMTEFFCSEHVHCDKCLVREKTVKRLGEEIKVKEYYHRAVQLILVGYEVPWTLGWEALEPGEGELTAALRMLYRVLPKVRRHLDAVVGDGLYMCRPFWQCLEANELAGIAFMSSEVTEPYQELLLYRACEPPQVPLGFERMGLVGWECQSDAWRKDIGCRLRLCWVERIWYPADAKHKHLRHHLRVATTLPKEVAPLRRLRIAATARWEQENTSFWYLKSRSHLSHNFRHHPVAIMVLAWLCSMALALFSAFGRFRRRYGEKLNKRAFSEALLSGLHQLAAYKNRKEQEALFELWCEPIDSQPP
jgi:hypothetical protein